MPIGSQPTWAQLNANATNVVLQARDAIDAISKFNAYLQGQGTANLEALASAAGDSTANTDVTELMTVFANLAAFAAAAGGSPYTGPALPFNFVEQTIPLWNAQ